MGLNIIRNQRCECGSGMKTKFCCLHKVTDMYKTYITKESIKAAKKTAKYFAKKYKNLTAKPEIKADALQR